MSFLGNLFNDPLYQKGEPRKPEEVSEPKVIISPDTRLDNVWGGVSTREFAKIVGIKPEAKFVLAFGYDYGWTTNLPLEYFLAEDALFAWSHDGEPIPLEHGGPVRLIVPQLYAWKSAKWIKGVRLLEQDEPGFWEEGGYHMRGNPWQGRDGERFRWQGDE